MHNAGYEQMVSAMEQVVIQSPLADLPTVIGDCERLKAMAWHRMTVGSLTATIRDDDLLTMPEVAKRLNISVYRAREMGRQGRLKTVQMDRSVRVLRSDLNDYLARRGH